jgi:hypothetical protein
MSTYYVINNQFTGSISATEFSTAAANLRMMGAKFTTKKSGSNFIVKFAFCPDFLRTHLLTKYAPKVEARATKRYWTTKAEYEAALRQAQGDTMSAQSLTQKADHKYRTRKPDPKSPHSATYYNPLASLLTTDEAAEADFARKVVPADQTVDVLHKNAIASGADSRPVASAIGNAPSFVTAQVLYTLTVERSKRNPNAAFLNDLAERYGVKGYKSMSKAAIVNALVGRIPTSDAAI